MSNFVDSFIMWVTWSDFGYILYTLYFMPSDILYLKLQNEG